MGTVELKIDDSALNIDLHAKCRFCNSQIFYCSNIFEIYNCPEHGFPLNQEYIMYSASERNNQNSSYVNVKIPSNPN